MESGKAVDWVKSSEALCERRKVPFKHPADYWLPSKVFLMAVSASRRFETERPTAAFRTMEPLTPVRPACSEPMAMIRKNPGWFESLVPRTQKERSSAVSK